MKRTIVIIAAAALLFSFDAQAQSKKKSSGAEKRNILKFEFFSPMTGNLTLGYERFINSETFNMSYLNYIGIVGLGGATEYENRSGVFLKTGPKFFFNDTSAMKGIYFHPEIIVGWHTIDDLRYFSQWDSNTQSNIGWTELQTEKFTHGSFLLTLGYQKLIKNVFAIDFYGGVGYGFSSNYYDHYMYSGFILETAPVAFTGSFSFGYLF